MLYALCFAGPGMYFGRSWSLILHVTYVLVTYGTFLHLILTPPFFASRAK